MARPDNTFSNVLFKPSVLRTLQNGSTRIENITLGSFEDGTSERVKPSGSFRYDSPGSALKNTQQLNVDFSKFEKHTFLNSAEMKVQTAFDQIINGFPFDGKKSEYINYIDSLSGYQKHVLDTFPKSEGYLRFERQSPEGSTIDNYLSIEDFTGRPNISPNMTGKGEYVLDFSATPFTAEMHVFVPSGSINDNEVLLQKISGSNKGLTIALTSSHNSSSPYGKVDIVTILSSGSNYISSSVSITKGEFHHFASVYDRFGSGKISTYVDGYLEATSSVGVYETLGFQDENMTIGSGSSHQVTNSVFTPTQQFSGSIDELRFFKSPRTIKQLQKFSYRSIFPPNDNSLKLYFRFNEPSGSFGDLSTNDNLVLDHSGNGLHTKITMGSGGSFDMRLRNTGSKDNHVNGTWVEIPNPLTAENPALSPILFPSFNSVKSHSTILLNSASSYDSNNPNLITRLIPKHYFLEANEFEGFVNEEGDIGEDYGFTEDVPGGGRMQSAQIMASMLYLWSETFDELKMFVDEFGRLLNVDYLDNDTISNHLLPFLAKYYGLNLPNAYANANLMQLEDGSDIALKKVHSNMGLQQIQNVIWRRVLTDLPQIFSSRGTRHSIEILFRNMGINPDGAFRIREYGGSRTKSISDSFEKRREIAAMLDFTGSMADPGTLDGSGKDSNRPLIQTAYLSGSRVSPGEPQIRGTFQQGISNNVNDGLFTSGSWSLEGLYKFQPKTGFIHPTTQSLLRIQTTGSSADGSANNWLIFNALAFKPDVTKSITGSVALFGMPVSGSSAPTVQLILSGVNIFDGEKWHISFGRKRNDQADSYVSSSYFLRAGKMGFDKIESFYETTSYYDDHGDNILNRVSSSNNPSGSMVVVGSQSLGYDTYTNAIHPIGGFLNTVTPVYMKNVNFTGRVSGVRFFTKALTQKETLTHIRNFKSVGVENPSINFNFNTVDSGSFERLRVNLTCDQPITMSNSSGDLRIFDFSQNMLHASGTGFESSKQVIHPERYDYMILSPRFELATDLNKIRVRSFKSIENIRKSPDGVSFAPLYSIPENEQPKDDRRLSVEVSCVQALNEDIVNIFATLDKMDNAIGDPELIFSEEYKSLRHLRHIYFNRLEEKVSLTKFFQFFKWFDSTVGGLIEEVIPSTTRYLGTNFVVESHALERPKFTYRFSDMYVGVLDRRAASVIFLQAFDGSIRKF